MRHGAPPTPPIPRQPRLRRAPPRKTRHPHERGPLLRAGEMRTITVRKGQHVRFRVRSATPEELHVHGYDLLRTLPIGRTVNVSFAANIEDILEIELERSAAPTQIAELPVLSAGS
jgi:hypothetical protein